ncbi:ATP-binding cassette domain-containing protein [Fulvivirgaceae bacterium BMA10]|uniref:ATP-binding cassette domain-containing protein n=1 Tax=Splendidivirga corallicola TaxID=3051826 RepID=A0ABT8KIM6_9BACT|nr:ATP-binding cassette domain-containing protein [Fulvivirgaceae bacterium BMA10]
MEILTANNINKSYAEHVALKNVSISIPKQSIFGLLGPNGAGKTTLIRIITQIIDHDSGEILINGEKLSPKHIGNIGYLPEERGLYKKMRVGEQLLYFAQLKGLTRKAAKDKIKHWFKKFDITDWWGKKVEDLSKGMQQKIQFIVTVLHEPELVILDEPFSGFDPINANIIKDEILELKENGSTIIFSTHRMESVEELCDDIALLHKSQKILDGPKKQIKEDFRSNTFIVQHLQDLTQLSSDFELLSKEVIEEDHFVSTIKLQNGKTPNDLIKNLIKEVEIYSFTEKIPSINDIFITKVKAGGHE